MNKYFLMLLFSAVFFACSPEDKSEEEPEFKPEILNLNTLITSPAQTRDYSFYDPEEEFEGYRGIFSNPAEELTFTGRIEVEYEKDSEENKVPDIEVVWRSDIDGLLYKGKPEENFETEIQKKLSKGIHTIYLEASVPGSQFVAIDSVILSNTIELQTESTGKSVKLKWSKYTGEDFVSYLVYKQHYTPVAEITDINTLEYEIGGATSFIAEHEYQVVVRTTTQYAHPVGSNISLAHPGIFFRFPHFVHKIIKDPFRAKIYAIVGPQYSFYDSQTFGILVIDVSSHAFKIESHILVDSKFADMDLSLDGQYLFLVQEYVDKITKLNLDNLEAETFVTNTYDWGFHKIEVGKDNTLYCHKNPPTSGSTSFWIFNGNNGSLIKSNESVLRHGDIEYNELHNALYGGESNTSHGTLYKFNVNASSIIRDTHYPIWPDGVTFPWPHIFISDDDQYIFWENFQLDPNLNVLRTFEASMKASSPGNKYISNYDNLYNFNNLSVVFKYPELPYHDVTSMVFMNDHTIILSRAENTGMNQEEYTYFFKINLEE